MKKRILALLLCAVMLITTFVIGAGAVSPDIPEGVTSSETVAASSLPYTVSYGTTDGKSLSSLTAFDAAVQTALQKGCNGITTDSVTGIPCQVYEIDASKATTTSVTITVHAATVTNERLALKVLNVAKGTWDTVDTVVTSGYLSADIERAVYADGAGKVKAMVTPDYVGNGSNRFIWSTDQQHYAEFEDLHATYYGIHEYMVNEYKNGSMAYTINTGDIVDDTPQQSTAAKQWVVADKAFKILDDAAVPYGIVTGNHDVGDFPTNNYTHYLKYFNAARYVNTPWFGGTMDDNKSHYDLVTVGNTDFVILYIGYGQGEQEALLKWADSVCKQFPHRAVILATHQYLRPTTMAYEGRAEKLYKEIVEPNNNVVMVLCGHYDGAAYRERKLDNGRIVHEVVADYQFVQRETDDYYKQQGVKDPTHSIGSVRDCNGEGYMREVIIEGNTVSMYAFSPITKKDKPFGARDEFSFTVNFPATNRFVTTYHFTVATLGDGDTVLTKWTFDDNSTAYAHLPEGGYSATKTNVSSDVQNLKALIDRAGKLDAAAYTAESFKTVTDAILRAKNALTQSNDTVRAAYTALSNAIGNLVKQKASIGRYSLVSVHDFNLNNTLWKNTQGVPELTNAKSPITFQKNTNGGFTIQKSKFSPNNWPAVQYTIPISFTPIAGRVYLYLDIVADTTWSIYPVFYQNDTKYSGRLNYIIEGSYKDTLDAGVGTYKGVYEITDALKALGLDLSKEIVMTFEMNIVPGPVTVNEISLLTGVPTNPQSTLNQAAALVGDDYTEESYQDVLAAVEALKKALNTPNERQATLDLLAAIQRLEKKEGVNWTLIIIISVAVAVVVVAAIVIICLVLKKKKKNNTEKADAAPSDDQSKDE